MSRTRHRRRRSPPRCWSCATCTELTPRYNRVGTTWQTVLLRAPHHRRGLAAARRSSTSRTPTGSTSARCRRGPWPPQVIEAVQRVAAAAPLHGARSAARPASRSATRRARRRSSAWRCARAPAAPTRRAYARAVATATAALTTTPELVLEPLWRRVVTAQRPAALRGGRRRAATGRTAFAGAVRRQRLADALRAAGELEVQLGGGDAAHRRRRARRRGRARAGSASPCRWPRRPPHRCPLPCRVPPPTRCSCWPGLLDHAGERARILWCSGEWSRPDRSRPPTHPPALGGVTAVATGSARCCSGGVLGGHPRQRLEHGRGPAGVDRVGGHGRGRRAGRRRARRPPAPPRR